MLELIDDNVDIEWKVISCTFWWVFNEPIFLVIKRLDLFDDFVILTYTYVIELLTDGWSNIQQL